MVVIKKLKRSIFEVLAPGMIFGAAILFPLTYRKKGSEEATIVGCLNSVSKICRLMKSGSSYLVVLLFFLLLSFRGAAAVPDPAGAISGRTTVCQGELNITYSVPVINNATSYIWSATAGIDIVSNSGNSIVVNILTSASSGSITVKGRSIDGDGTPSSLSITVNPIPLPAGTITGSATVCQGATSVNYSINAISFATNYVWTVPANASIVSSSDTPFPNITVNFSNTAVTGDVTVHGTNSCGNGVSSSHTVTVTPLVAAAGPISGTQTVCQGAASVSYSVNDIANATSYIWVYSGTGATITGSTKSVLISFSSNATPGNLTVRGTNSCGSGTVSANYAIAINPLPDASNVIAGPSSGTICQGSTGLVYSVTSIGNASSYNWTYSGTGHTFTNGNSSIIVGLSSSATSGDLTVTGINGCGNGVASPSYPVVVNKLPGAAGSITGTSTPCMGQTNVTYSIPAISDATSYVWTYSGNGASIAGSSNSVSITFSANATNGDLTVFGRNSCGDGTSKTLPISLALLPGAAGTISSNYPKVCQGQASVAYSVAAISNADASGYVWKYSGSGATINGTTKDVTITFSTNASTGNLTVYGTNACGDGAVSANYAITVNPLPVAAGVISGLPTVCAAQTGVAFSVPLITNATTYLWVNSVTGASFDDLYSRTPTVSFSTAGSGYFTVRGVNACGNGVISANYSITVNADLAPTLVMGSQGLICAGDPLFHDNTFNALNYSSLSWHSSGTGTFIGETTKSPTYFPSAADVATGSVDLTVIATAISPCTSSISGKKKLVIQAKPLIDAGPDTEICQDQVYTTLLASASNTVTTRWSSSSSGTTDFVDFTLPIATYRPNANDISTGGVTLTLSGTSVDPPCNGTITDSFYLSIIKFPTVNIINASICANAVYTVTGASASNYSTLEWSTSGSGTFSDKTLLMPVYTPSTADIASGTVTLTLTAFPKGPCNAPVSKTMVLTIVPIADVSAGPDASVCQGGSYTIMGVAHHHDPTNIVWSTNGTGLFNGNSIQPTYTPSAADVNAGSIILTVTVSSLSGCVASVSDFMVLTVIPTPVVNVGPDATVCAGSSFPITVASAPAGATLLWSKTTGTGAFSNQSIIDPTYIPSAADLVAGQVRLKLTAQPVSPCTGSISDEFVLSFVTPPTADAGPNVTICQTQSTYTISGSASNSSNLSWVTSGDGTFIGGNTLAPTYSPGPTDIAAGSVTLTLHAGGTVPCAEATDFMVLTLVHTPSISAGASSSMCQGNSFTVGDATAIDYVSLLWSHNGLGTLQRATTLTPTYVPGTGEIGIVTLTLTATAYSLCGGQVTATKTITIQSTPTANAGPNDQVCQPNTYTIIGATATNAGTINWTSSGSGNFTNNGTLTPTYHPTSTDFSLGRVTLTLQVIGSNSCSTPVTDNMVLTLISAPLADAGLDAIVCQGGSYKISSANAAQYSTLIWTVSGTGTLTGATALTPTYTPSAADALAGSVTLTLTVHPNSPCAADAVDQMVITVQSPPTANAGVDASTCEGTAYTLSGSVTNNSAYAWTTNGSGSFTGIGTLTPSYIPSAADARTGNVKITLTAVAKSPCASNVSDEMTLLVFPRPVVNAGSDATICASGSYDLSAVSPLATAVNSASIQWSTSGDGAFSNILSLHPTYTPGPGDISSGQVRLTLTGQPNTPCSTAVSDYLVLTVIGQPTANAGPPSVSICKEGYTISSATATNYSSILWTKPIGNTGTLTNANSLTPTYVPSSTEIANGASVTLTMTVTGASQCGSSTATDNIILMVRPIAPVISILNGNSSTFCEGNSITLTGAPSGYNYNWTPGGTTTQNLVVTTSGNYHVAITDPVTGCTSPSSNSINVTVNPSPKLSGNLTQPSICSGSPPFTYSPASLTTGTSYTWIRPVVTGISNAQASGGNGADPNEILINTTSSQVIVTYIYTLTANNCTNTQNVTVPVNPSPVLTSSLAPPSICSGSPFSYPPTSSTTSSTTSATFSWNRQQISGILNATASGTGNPNEVLYNSTTAPIAVTYLFYGSISGCQNPTPALVVVIVNPTPSLTSTLTPTSICSGSFFSYTPISNPVGANMTWSRASVTGISQPTSNGSGNVGEYLTNTTGLPINVTYVYTTTLNGCSSKQNVVVTVNPVPTLSSSLVIPPICTGSTLNYAATSSTTGALLNWSRATISGISESGSSGTGSISEPLTNSTPAPIKVTYLYSLSANGCSNTSPYSVVATVQPVPVTPVITVTGSKTFCEGSSATLTSTAASAYEWSNGKTTQAIAATTAGSYSVVTADIAGCHSDPSIPVDLIVNPAPSPPVSGGDITQCVDGIANHKYTATATVSTGSSLTWWDKATGGNSVVNPTLPSNAVNTITYFAESKDNITGCTGLTRTAVTITVVDYPAPPPTIVDQAACQRATIPTLTATAVASPGSTLRWFTVASGGNPITLAPTLSTVGTITYYAESYIAASGCASFTRTPAKLTINAAPTAPTSLGTFTQCAQDPLQTLTALATAPGGSTVVWYADNTRSTLVSQPIWNQVGPMSYYAESVDNITSCTSLAVTRVNLTINPTPDAPIPGNPSLLDPTVGEIKTCELSPIQTLTATATLPTTAPTGTTIRWFTTPVLGTPLAANAQIRRTVGTSIFYAESYIATGTCPSLTRTKVTLTIDAAPAKLISKGNLTKCAETLTSIVPLDANSQINPVLGVGIEWYNAVGDIVGSPILSDVGTTTYFAEAKNLTTDCRSLTRTSVTLTINASPAPLDSLKNITECATTPLQTLTAALTTTDGSLIRWYAAPTGGNALPRATLNAVRSTTFYAEAYKGTCMLPTRMPVTLTINGLPAIPVSRGNLIACANDSVIQTLDASTRIAPSTLPNIGLDWFTTATLGTPVSPTLSDVGTVTYYAEAKDLFTDCRSSRRTAVTLTLSATPAPPESGGDVIQCVGRTIQTITAKVINVPTGVTVSWYNTPTGGTPNPFPVLNALGTKSYYAEARLGSCVSSRRTKVTLTINPLSANPTYINTINGVITPVCEPDTVNAAKWVKPGALTSKLFWYDALTAGNQVSPLQTAPPTRTVYAESVDSITGCAASRRFPVTMTVNSQAPPTLAIKYPLGVIKECAKSPVQTLNARSAITIIAGLTLKWYDQPTGGVLVTTPTWSTVNDSITYYAAYQKPGGCESITRTPVKLMITTPLVNASSNSPRSLGQELDLFGGPQVTGYSYIWTDPRKFTYTGMDQIIPSVTAAMGGMYKLTVTDAAGCSSSDSTKVYVNSAKASFQPTCIGGTLYLSGWPDNAKYLWTGPNNFTSMEQSPAINNVTAAMAGRYKLQLVDSGGTSSADSINVTFKPLPIPLISVATLCPTGYMQLSGNPTGMASYIWTGPGGGLLQVDPKNPRSPLPLPYQNPADSIRYSLTVKDLNGCEASTSVVPVPFTPKATYNTPLCSGDTLKLRGEPSGMASYNWKDPAGATISSLQSPIVKNVTLSGVYVLTVRNPAGCTYSTTVDVKFSTPVVKPVITISPNPACEGNDMTLLASPSGMNTYEWSGPNGFTSTDQNPLLINIKPVNAGTYNLKVTNGCTSYANPVTLSVSTVTFVGTYGPYCTTDSKVTLITNQTGVIFNGPGIKGNVFDPALAGVGVHSIQYTLNNPQCTVNSFIQIEVFLKPTLVVNPSALILKSCTGTTSDLTLPTVTAGSSNGLTLSYWRDAKATVLLTTPKAVTAGTYYIKGTSKTGKCFDIQTAFVGQPDSLRAKLIPSADLSCAGDTTGTMTVNVTLGTAPFNYMWSTKPAQITPTAKNLKAGIYTVVITDAKKCVASFTDEIKEPPPIKLGFSVKSVQCMSDANGSASVDTINGITDLTILGKNFTYKWYTNPVQTTRDALRLTPLWHKIAVTDLNGCVRKDSIFVSVADTMRPVITCPKDINLTVEYLKTNDFNPNKYIVDLGKPLFWDNCSIVDTMVYNDAPVKFSTGETLVKWTVTDRMGLINSCVQKVYVKEIPSIPQMISPNGDGLNDKFLIDGLTAKEYRDSQMLVFTRSGQLVFQSNNYEDPANAWDGKYAESTFSKNQLVAPGVYYYILKLGGSSGQTLRGYVYVYY